MANITIKYFNYKFIKLLDMCLYSFLLYRFGFNPQHRSTFFLRKTQIYIK